jgi:hypothetical protein
MTDDAKKEKVIHTRVSEDLERDLKNRASQLGISVSNLVRNVLTNTVDLVETIVLDSARVAGSAKEFAQAKPKDENIAAEIVGWQELVLNVNAVCLRCNEILPHGTRAAVAIRDVIDSSTVRCLTCLEAFASGLERDAQ